jgi:hypothetical protein
MLKKAGQVELATCFGFAIAKMATLSFMVKA